MSKAVDYYFSISSPWAYLGLDRFKALAAEHDLTIEPYLITIIETNGAIPSKNRPVPRRAYWQKDLLRWARHLGKTVVLENRPPTDWVPASFMIIAAQLDGLDWIKLVAAMQERWWGKADDIGLPEVRKQIADDAGFDGAALLAREQDPDVQAKWKANLERAEANGIFGSPTYVYEGEPYWGQDSLPFLKMHLTGEMVPLQAAE
jgi:2-hydroxychromene-2-carboxylate isomerase